MPKADFLGINSTYFYWNLLSLRQIPHLGITVPALIAAEVFPNGVEKVADDSTTSNSSSQLELSSAAGFGENSPGPIAPCPHAFTPAFQT